MAMDGGKSKWAWVWETFTKLYLMSKQTTNHF